MNVSLNETCKLITGCSTVPTVWISLILTEENKQDFEGGLCLFCFVAWDGRLRSKNCFADKSLVEPSELYAITENPPSGSVCNWQTWRTLNRIRTNFTRWACRTQKAESATTSREVSLEYVQTQNGKINKIFLSHSRIYLGVVNGTWMDYELDSHILLFLFRLSELA